MARYAVYEIGPHAIKVVQIFLDGLHRDVRPALAQLLGPDGLAGVVHVIRVRRVVPDWLTQYRRGDALWRLLHQLHRERAADAVAEEEELVDAEMVHHAQLVVR